MPSVSETLKGTRVLLVAPSLAIMGGQAVQADLLLRNLRNEGVAVDLLPINPAPWGRLKEFTRIKYVRTLIVSILYIGSLLLKIPHYDVIHIFSASYFSFILAPAPALLIAKMYGKKTILNYRSGEAADHFSRSGKRIFWIIRKADKIVVPSGYLVGIFSGFGFQAEAISNISDFSSFHYRERTTIRPKILVPRNLEPLYDIETAIRAFVIVKAKYSDATLTITGSGSDEQRLKTLARDLGVADVVFTGRVERTAMPQLFDAADIFLNSSVIDNMPVAIIEAFYAGLPVVTTNAGGIPFIVYNRRNGILAQMGDAKGLAAAVCKVTEDAELRRTIIAGGRADAQKCSWEQVKLQWARTYRELLDLHG
jgi:glycosyltransferase involved in cell wall biosynthesis